MLSVISNLSVPRYRPLLQLTMGLRARVVTACRVQRLVFDIFPKSMLSSRAVSSASLGMAPPLVADEFDISVALVVHLEMYALGFSRVATSRARVIFWP